MCSMEFLEVIPGRNIGKLHVLKKVGSLNGEECFLCRDERGRNIQFVESEIITQAGEAPEVVEEEVVEETPSADESQDNEDTPPDGEPEPEQEVSGVATKGDKDEESPKEETQEEKLEDKTKKGWLGKGKPPKKKGGK